jgi:hypothetical protein
VLSHHHWQVPARQFERLEACKAGLVCGLANRYAQVRRCGAGLVENGAVVVRGHGGFGSAPCRELVPLMSKVVVAVALHGVHLLYLKLWTLHGGSVRVFGGSGMQSGPCSRTRWCALQCVVSKDFVC